MRTFVAIPIAPAVAKIIAEAIPHSAVEFPFESIGYHITLVFLGNVELERVRTVVERIKAMPFSKFSVSIRNFDFFRKPANNIVFASVLDRDGDLTRLRVRIDAILQEFGFPPASLPYRPHVTIGITTDEHASRLQAASFEVSFRVDQIVFFQSFSAASGGPYKLIANVAAQ